MRHGKKFNHLGRTAPHRKAMLSNMATSLILNKRITTTVAKAKALRKYVEPILTRAKDDTTHSRRVVFSYLNNKESVKTLFDEVATKIADRPGGYTRILKTGSRLGDNADMCIIELVDYNELLLGDTAKKTKTRRSRRGKGASIAPKDSKPVAVEEKTQESPVEEAVVEDAVEAVETEAEMLMPGGHMDTSVDAYSRPSRWSECEGHAAIEMAGTPEGVVGKPTLGDANKAKKPLLAIMKYLVLLIDEILEAFPPGTVPPPEKVSLRDPKELEPYLKEPMSEGWKSVYVLPQAGPFHTT